MSVFFCYGIAMLLLFLVVAALLFVLFISVSLWLGSGKDMATKPDGTLYNAEVAEAAKKSTKALGRSLTLICCLGLVVCGVWYFWHCKSDRLAGSELVAIEEGCGSTAMAYVISQDFIKRELKSPSTAKFPAMWKSNVVDLGDCRFRVRSYVDAQNAFGAMLRTSYAAEVEYLPATKTWRINNLSLEQ